MFQSAGSAKIRLKILAPLIIPNPDKPERIATKAPRHKAELFDNRSGFRGSGFKGYICWKLLTIVIKIRDTRLHPLGETAF
jgi:hypothetical protein